jgi:hypothetical protein
LNWPAPSCALRSAIERWLNRALDKVSGTASSAVGPAELASGVKFEKGLLAASAGAAQQAAARANA